MESISQSRTITDPQTIHYLTNPGNHRYLRSFMDEETTVNQVACQLGESVQRVFRQVQRMLERGLLEQTRLQTRTGRAIRHYRASSDLFFVPFSGRSFEEVLREGNLPFEQRFIAAIAREWDRYVLSNAGWGTSYARGPHGELTIRAPLRLDSEVIAPPPPLVFTRYQELRLCSEDAQALFAELTSLTKRFETSNGGGQQTYLLRIGMAPTSTH